MGVDKSAPLFVTRTSINPGGRLGEIQSTRSSEMYEYTGKLETIQEAVTIDCDKIASEF